MTNIVGIAAHFHDASCCLLQEGRLIAAAEEERFSRVKFDARLPKSAFRYCLERGGIGVRDIDCVAYYDDPVLKLGRQLWMTRQRATGTRPAQELDPARAEREIREMLDYQGPIMNVGHHLSHAASSFYFSGFPEAALMTVDAVGEWTTTSYGSAAGASLELFEEVQFPDSLGLLYSTVTSYLGFRVNCDEYKVMGLAPYGRPALTGKVGSLVKVLPRGQYELDMRYFDFCNPKRMYTDALPELFGHAAREAGAQIESFHQDLACSLQRALEEILIEKVRYLHGERPSENLCMAGGVALNCVANGRIRRAGPFKSLFIQPAAGDSGAALGAAAIAHIRTTGQAPRERQTHAYLGPEFPSAAIFEVLNETPVRFADYRGREQELIAATARSIIAGLTVGWFQGRMEFGPRALGARSILADPRHPGMRDRINQQIKQREMFRPFAPAVLESRVAEYFDIDHASPFMLEVANVSSKMALPAVTHVDGSARVQTVAADVAPRFASLLMELERLSGCAVVLNTSFNMNDEPIVCTPLDALRCFARSGLDILVLGDFIIERSGLPRSWAAHLPAPQPPMAGSRDDRGAGHDVYTFF